MHQHVGKGIFLREFQSQRSVIVRRGTLRPSMYLQRSRKALLRLPELGRLRLLR